MFRHAQMEASLAETLLVAAASSLVPKKELSVRRMPRRAQMEASLGETPKTAASSFRVPRRKSSALRMSRHAQMEAPLVEILRVAAASSRAPLWNALQDVVTVGGPDDGFAWTLNGTAMYFSLATGTGTGSLSESVIVATIGMCTERR